MTPKNEWLLVRSIIKKSKGLTVGLWLLFFLMTVIVITVLVLPDSVIGTVENFLTDYGMPQAWVTTKPGAVRTFEIEGISSVEADFAADMIFKNSEDAPLSLRVFSMEPDSRRDCYAVEETENDSGLPGMRITFHFAEVSGIHVGDTLTVMTPRGAREVFVDALISLPEGIVCVRDETSWQDSDDFGYAYFSREDYDGLFGTVGFANQWFVRFDDGLTHEQKEAALAALAAELDINADTAVLFETSAVRQTLDTIFDALTTACLYFPMAIFVVGLFFCGLFVRQLVMRDRKKIGLLRALGYSARQILTVFLIYIVLLCVSALLPGIFAGALTVRAIADIFRNMYALPGIEYSFSPLLILLFLLLVLLTGAVSCLASARSISGIDPCEAYSDLPPAAGKLPRWFSKLHAEPFTKTAVGSVLRNRSRFFRSVLSVCACIVLMMGALLYRASQNEVFPVTFGGRFCYDFTACVSEGGDVLSEIRAVDGVDAAEPVIAFSSTLGHDGETAKVLVNGLCDGTELVVPRDLSGTPLSPGDGIILDEWTAKELGIRENDTVTLGDLELRVEGIARELVNSTQYISAETAALLGESQYDMVAVKLAAEADRDAVLRAAAEFPGCVGTTQLSHQEHSYRDMIRLVNIMLGIVTGIALFLGIVIIYNMVVLNLNERRCTYATLSALGATAKDFAVIALWENLLLYIAALILACPIAYFVAKQFLAAMSNGSGGQYLPIIHPGRILLISAALSIIYLIVGMAVTLIKILRSDPAPILNVGE